MTSNLFEPNRREVIAGASALVAASALPLPAFASNTIKVGDFEITSFSDGHINLPTSMRITNPDPDKQKVYERAGLTAETFKSPINVTLINTPDELILIDFGSGPRFVPTTGKLEGALSDAGVDPAAISKVILTHGHPDHLWGATNDFDELTFPEAAYYVAEKEFAFWRDPDEASKSLPEDRQAFAIGAKTRFDAIEERVKFMKEGDEIVSGIGIIETNGHTQGHVSVEVNSGSEKLVVLGDALTSSVISFEYPEWLGGTDHLPDVAAATRKRLLDKLHNEKALIIGYHLPPPGIGRVVKKGSGYAYEAVG